MVAGVVEVFVAAQSFASEKVGVEPFHACGAVFVVYVHHHAERGAFGDYVACLHVVRRVAVFEESEFDALDAEFVVCCKHAVSFESRECRLVDINQNANSLLLCIFDSFRQVECAHRFRRV